MTIESPKHDLLQELRAKHIKFRFAEVSDAAFIFSLRSDPTKNAYLSPTAGAVASQEAWLADYKQREAAGLEYYFVIEELDGTSCGVVRLYDISRTAFTWGSWILATGAPKTAAIESALLVYTFAYEHLGLTDCRFEVDLDNARTLAFHDRFGATRTHRDDKNQYYVYPKYRWTEHKPQYAEFL